ncbi:hypothetical protein ACFXDF_11600, partial [Streptomyces sp. NPDC059426]
VPGEEGVRRGRGGRSVGQRLGYGLPAELTALWRLCGGVKHQEIEGDEQEEVASGVFLPGGVVLTPGQAMSAVFLGGDHGWGAPVVVRLRGPGQFCPLLGRVECVGHIPEFADVGVAEHRTLEA